MNITEHKDRLAYLLQQYAVKKTGAEEEDELYLLIEESDDETLKNALLPILESSESLEYFDEARWRPMMERVVSHETGVVSGDKEADSRESLVVSMKPRIQVWKRIAVAASIVGVLFVAGYLIVNRERGAVNPGQTAQVTNDVKAPDKNRAQIKLSDGSIVYLDSAGNGTLATQGNVHVVKSADGAIAYEGASTSLSMTYNTLFNPRGSKVQPLTLSDGTKVWLNSESSLKYPTAFVGNMREVEITGEAYFEVAKDATKKFVVKSNGVTTEVLGTHFNVNTYEDENDIKVTLLEGSVKVVNRESTIVIKPGQQARVSNTITVINDADIEQVMAWKNGLFDFREASIETIMQELSRWYGIDVKYEAKIDQHYMGKIYRTSNASEVLKMLEVIGGVHFRIEGNVVTVMK